MKSAGVGILGSLIVLTLVGVGCASSCPRCKSVAQSGAAVSINSRLNNGNVEDRVLVEGSVAKECGQPWLIIHPLEVSSSWVQRQPVVDGEGNWRTNAYIGDPGKHWGQKFELIAVACPSQSLAEGQVLDGIPAAEAISKTVLVTKTLPGGK